MRKTPAPKLELANAEASAITYTLLTPRGDRDAGYRHWALCTVNDKTGELLITSDWGSWSYTWSPSPKNLGEPTLTAFLGRCRSDYDYIAMKLLGRAGARRFSADKTCAHLRGILCKRRLKDGQEVNEYICELQYDEEGTTDRTPLDRLIDRAEEYVERGRRYDHGHVMTAGMARELWDAIGGIAADVGGGNETAQSLFTERFMQLDGHELVVPESPWEEMQDETSHEYTILMETILPALVASCAQTHLQRTQRAGFHNAPQPVEAEA